MQEGDVNRRFRRSVSFVTGASAVIVALALMAVADGGGKLPGIGHLPVLGIPGLGPRTAAPGKPHNPSDTPAASEQPIGSQSAIPIPVHLLEGTTTPPTNPPPTDLVTIDNPAPVTTPLVTPPPVAKKPRPEPVPVTSPSAPPNETPPKRPFGGPGIAGTHGSGRGLGSGSAGTTSGGKKNGKHNGKQHGKQNGTHGPKQGKSGGKGKPKPKDQPPHGTGSRADDADLPHDAPQDGSCPTPGASAAR